MRRLIVNPGTDSAWEIPLPTGIITLGSDPASDFSIVHPSVAPAHCQVMVMDSGVTVKNLSADSPIWVDGRPVEETVLLPGQTLRLGEVDLRFEASLPTPAPKSTTLPVTVASPEEKSFYAQIPGALHYPFRGNGPVLLLSGAIFFGVLGFLQGQVGRLGPYGFVPGLFVGVFVTGYLFNYAKSIITTTANAEAEPPNWPDCSSWQDDIVSPCLQFVGLLTLFFAPVILLHFWHPESENATLIVQIAALALSALLLPMGMLAMALFDNFAALNPVLLLTAIARVPLAYLAAAAGFELLLAIYWFGGELIFQLLPLPVLPGLLAGFINLYLTVAAMRILGLFYLDKKAELGWF